MLCPECGKEYENAYGFCPWCGAVSRPEPADTAGAGSTADAAGSPQQAIIQGLPASMVPRMSPAKRSTVWLLCFILAAGICIYGSVSLSFLAGSAALLLATYIPGGAFFPMAGGGTMGLMTGILFRSMLGLS